jgi:tetratricopeptide (TPR) repeat protein
VIWFIRWLAVSLLVLASFGCRAHGESKEPRGDDPARWAEVLEARVARNPKDDVAWRDLAHVYWLHLGKTPSAIPILDRLAKGGDSVARLSRMLIADGRAEEKVLLGNAYALIDAVAKKGVAPRSEFDLAAAEVAARLLDAVLGQLEGDDTGFEAFYAGLALDGLPPAIRRPMLSARADIARAKGEDYAPYHRAQGCVQKWQIGPVVGVRGEMELARPENLAGEGAKSAAFVVDPKADAVPLACVVRLWNPTIHAGIRRIRTFLTVSGDALELEFESEEPIVVHLDGKLLLRTDLTDRHPLQRNAMRVPVTPGVHALEIATSLPRDRAWVLVRANTPQGAPITASAEPPGGATGKVTGPARPRTAPWRVDEAPLVGRIYAPLRRLLALKHALSVGDVDAAEVQSEVLARRKAPAEAHLTRALFERFDPTRGRTVSLARERAALQAALKRDPKLDAARLRALGRMLERGEEAEVEEALRKLPKDRMRSVEGELFRVRAALARGDEARAEEALARAAKKSPNNCRVLGAQRARAREHGNVRREDEVMKKLATCSGTLELRADVAQERGRFDEARALWDEAIRRVPDDLDAIEARARLAMVEGDLEGARKLLAGVLARNPLRVGAHVALADTWAAVDDMTRAKAELQHALAKLPHSDALHRAAELVGIPDDLARLRVDGLAALADYKKSGKVYEGVAEVLVLDRSAARVYGNGGQRQIVHLVVHLLSKAALDRYGEIAVPPGARLLTLRTIKPDGTLLEAEVVPGKEGLELRDLAIGDVVEYEFVVEREPATALPGYVDVSTFRFQSLDIPYHRSELLVVHPRTIPLREDKRRSPPEPKLGEMEVAGETLVTRLYRADRMERRGEEPGHRALLDELPNVRVYTPLDMPGYLEGLALQIRKGQRSNVELRRRARKIVGDVKDPRAKLEALWSWVVENVEDAGDLSASATSTLSARAGSRLMLLRAMLREAGIHAELWLARDSFGPDPLAGGHPMPENYDAAMLAVTLPGQKEPVMVLTASKVIPIGYLAPAYAKSEGLRVHLEAEDGPAGDVRLPKAPAHLLDARKTTLSIEVADSGSAKVTGTIVLSGAEAIGWRQALRDVDRDRIREVFQQAELGWLPGATLKKLDIQGESALERPLVLEFAADVPQYAIKQGGALMLRASPLPLSLASRHTVLPKRTTGLVIPYAPKLEADVTVALPGGVLREVPSAANISTEFGKYERKVVEGGVGQAKVRMQFRSEVVPGVIEPAKYEALADFARKVDSVEQALLRAGE